MYQPFDCRWPNIRLASLIKLAPPARTPLSEPSVGMLHGPWLNFFMISIVLMEIKSAKRRFNLYISWFFCGDQGRQEIMFHR